MDEGQPLLGLQLQRVLVGIGEGLAMQHHLTAPGAHGVHLQCGRGGGHDDDGPAAQFPGRQGHALCMVAGRGGDDTPGPFLGAEQGHLVVGAAQLEGEDGLRVLALEPYLIADAGRQGRGRIQRGFVRDLVDAGVQDPFQVFDGHGCDRKAGEVGRRVSDHGECCAGHASWTNRFMTRFRGQ